MDEIDDFIEYLESRIRKIRSDIRDFYKKYPQHSPNNRGEDINDMMMLPEKRLAKELKDEILNEYALIKRNTRPQRKKVPQKKK